MTGLARDATPLLDVDDLRTTFDTRLGPLRAVDGVSLRLEQGETYGVVGESGSGKTVLARSILNLLPTRTATITGSVKLNGEELVGLDARAMRDVWGRKAGMIFQDPMTALNATMRVGNQITESLYRHLKMGRGEAHATAVALLRSVGIPEPERRMHAYPHQLSGGMRQRVTIAIALACGPRLLMADEPTTALDVTIQRQILDLLGTLKRDRAMGMILITHDLGVVAGRTDHIAVMYAGRVVERAATRVLFKRPRHPYTHGLLASIPRLDQPSHSRLQVIPGRPPDLTLARHGCAFAPRCPYAQDRCREEDPVLTETELGHEHACFFPIGTDYAADAAPLGDAAAAGAADAAAEAPVEGGSPSTSRAQGEAADVSAGG